MDKCSERPESLQDQTGLEKAELEKTEKLPEEPECSPVSNEGHDGVLTVEKNDEKSKSPEYILNFIGESPEQCDEKRAESNSEMLTEEAEYKNNEEPELIQENNKEDTIKTDSVGSEPSNEKDWQPLRNIEMSDVSSENEGDFPDEDKDNLTKNIDKQNEQSLPPTSYDVDPEEDDVLHLKICEKEKRSIESDDSSFEDDNVEDSTKDSEPTISEKQKRFVEEDNSSVSTDTFQSNSDLKVNLPEEECTEDQVISVQNLQNSNKLLEANVCEDTMEELISSENDTNKEVFDDDESPSKKESHIEGLLGDEACDEYSKLKDISAIPTHREGSNENTFSNVDKEKCDQEDSSCPEVLQADKKDDGVAHSAEITDSPSKVEVTNEDSLKNENRGEQLKEKEANEVEIREKSDIEDKITQDSDEHNSNESLEKLEVLSVEEDLPFFTPEKLSPSPKKQTPLKVVRLSIDIDEEDGSKTTKDDVIKQNTTPEEVKSPPSDTAQVKEDLAEESLQNIDECTISTSDNSQMQKLQSSEENLESSEEVLDVKEVSSTPEEISDVSEHATKEEIQNAKNVDVEGTSDITTDENLKVSDDVTVEEAESNKDVDINTSEHIQAEDNEDTPRESNIESVQQNEVEVENIEDMQPKDITEETGENLVETDDLSEKVKSQTKEVEGPEIAKDAEELEEQKSTNTPEESGQSKEKENSQIGHVEEKPEENAEIENVNIVQTPENSEDVTPSDELITSEEVKYLGDPLENASQNEEESERNDEITEESNEEEEKPLSEESIAPESNRNEVNDEVQSELITAESLDVGEEEISPSTKITSAPETSEAIEKDESAMENTDILKLLLDEGDQQIEGAEEKPEEITREATPEFLLPKSPTDTDTSDDANMEEETRSNSPPKLEFISVEDNQMKMNEAELTEGADTEIMTGQAHEESVTSNLNDQEAATCSTSENNEEMKQLSPATVETSGEDNLAQLEQLMQEDNEQKFRKIEEMLSEMDSGGDKPALIKNDNGKSEMSCSDLFATLSDIHPESLNGKKTSEKKPKTMKQAVNYGKYTAINVTCKEALVSGKVGRVYLERLDMDDLLRRNIYNETVDRGKKRKLSESSSHHTPKKSKTSHGTGGETVSPESGPDSLLEVTRVEYVNGKKTNRKFIQRPGSSWERKPSLDKHKMVVKSSTKLISGSKKHELMIKKKILEKKKLLALKNMKLKPKLRLNRELLALKTDMNKVKIKPKFAKRLSDSFKKSCGIPKKPAEHNRHEISKRMLETSKKLIGLPKKSSDVPKKVGDGTKKLIEDYKKSAEFKKYSESSKKSSEQFKKSVEPLKETENSSCKISVHAGEKDKLLKKPMFQTSIEKIRTSFDDVKSKIKLIETPKKLISASSSTPKPSTSKQYEILKPKLKELKQKLKDEEKMEEAAPALSLERGRGARIRKINPKYKEAIENLNLSSSFQRGREPEPKMKPHSVRRKREASVGSSDSPSPKRKKSVDSDTEPTNMNLVKIVDINHILNKKIELDEEESHAPSSPMDLGSEKEENERKVKSKYQEGKTIKKDAGKSDSTAIDKALEETLNFLDTQDFLLEDAQSQDETSSNNSLPKNVLEKLGDDVQIIQTNKKQKLNVQEEHSQDTKVLFTDSVLKRLQKVKEAQPENVEPPPKRKRGRPPKKKPEELNYETLVTHCVKKCLTDEKEGKESVAMKNVTKTYQNKMKQALKEASTSNEDANASKENQKTEDTPFEKFHKARKTHINSDNCMCDICTDTKHQKFYILVDNPFKKKKDVIRPRFIAFKRIVKNIKQVKLPSKNWQVKLGLSESNKVIQVTCSDIKTKRNVQLSCFKSGYDIIFDGKYLRLVGAPEFVDTLHDLSILLNIVNNINPNDPLLESKN